jgi:ABC-type Co2+ transport system permease subunit
VLWGAYLGGDLYAYLQCAQASDSAASLKSVLSIIAVGGVATLPIGYAIGILTILLLKLLALLGLFPHRVYDVPISKQALQKIWRKLRVPEGAKKTPLCAASLFEFVLLRPEVHSWIFRRWTSFNISAQCAMAMLSSYFVVKATHNTTAMRMVANDNVFRLRFHRSCDY